MGAFEGGGDNWKNIFLMSEFGDSGKHAAVRFVKFNLGRNNIADDGKTVVGNGGAGFVATGINT